MKQPRKNAPHRRPKHERRTQNTRQTPHSDYTNRERGKHYTTVIFDEMPRRQRLEGDDAWRGDAPYLEERSHGFVMPPDEKEPSTAKVTVRVLAFVLGGLALMYAITWVYGHFRWGW